MTYHLRIARPVTDLSRARQMYCAGLGWVVLGAFEDHEGFDGVMVGAAGAPYHLEFTRRRKGPVAPGPSEEDLVVLYVPDRPDWDQRCAAMRLAGFREVPSLNPYWDRDGRTFQDPDGYRLVLQHADWGAVDGAPPP